MYCAPSYLPNVTRSPKSRRHMCVRDTHTISVGNAYANTFSNYPERIKPHCLAATRPNRPRERYCTSDDEDEFPQ